MATEILCIRHGETLWNQQLKYQGHQDIKLNKNGCRQAERLGNFLGASEINLIYASDLTRARDTAEKIAAHHDLEVKMEQGLREINFGEWEGLTYREISVQYPLISKKWIEDPLSATPPGAEEVVEFEERVVKTFNDIAKKNNGKKIAVVTHGGCIKIWLTHLLGMSLKDSWKLNVDAGSISIVRIFSVSEDTAALSLLNSTAHLQEQDLIL